MQELGEMLRAVRREKGLTLADAEEATRIRQRYLEALEYGDENGLPAPVYVEGFLRGYAAYLGLPPHAVLAKYQAAQADRQPAVTDLRLPIREIRMPSTFNWGWTVLAAVLLAAAFLAGSAYLQSVPGLTSWLPAWLPASGPAAPDPTPTAAGSLVATATPATPDGAPVVTPEATAVATPEPTAVPTATPVPVVAVEVRISSTSWLRVTVDDQVAFEGTLEAGTTRTWTGMRTVALRAGNAGGTEVTVNGVSKGSLGAPGQVVDVAWTAP